LAGVFRTGRAAHAYLFSGPRGVGKTAIALEFAALVLCDREEPTACGTCRQCLSSGELQHPDLHLLFPLPSKKAGSADDDEREFASLISSHKAALAHNPYMSSKPAKAKDIRIGLVRTLLHRTAIKPFQASRKVVVVLNADTMNDATQNALLKALEEPAPDAYFLLTTENEGGLLPTIRSRCQRIRVSPLTSHEIAGALVQSGTPEEQAILAAAMGDGSFSRALELSAANLSELQQRVIGFLRASAMCDPMELQTSASALLDTGHLPEEIALEFLGLFLRDVAVLRASGQQGSHLFLFHGFQETIQGVLTSYPQADFEEAVRAVDRAADFLGRGYTREWVLYALAIRLHECLGPRASSNTKSTQKQHA